MAVRYASAAWPRQTLQEMSWFGAAAECGVNSETVCLSDGEVECAVRWSVRVVQLSSHPLVETDSYDAAGVMQLG